MPEFFGSDAAVHTQKSLRDMQAEIDRTPSLSNGGRILNILEPDRYGWENIAHYLDGHPYVSLTAVPKQQTLAKAREVFGNDVDLPYWEAFFGKPDNVLPACQQILTSRPLANGWRIASEVALSADMLDAFQDLNNENGVAPTPGYYLRGEACPSICTMVWDDSGKMVGNANATMRYHPQGRLGGTLFAGAVSVSGARRRLGLGTLVNAAMLCDAHAAFGWTRVLEQAKADNTASCGMIRKCGLTNDPKLVTILINPSGAHLTR
jgi:Acetyltransferase (GNAT) family